MPPLASPPMETTSAPPAADNAAAGSAPAEGSASPLDALSVDEWKHKCEVLETQCALLERRTAGTLVEKNMELESELFDKGNALVDQCNKNLLLSDRVKKVKDQREAARKELTSARMLLVRGVAGEGVEVDRYKHVPFPELVRLRLLVETNKGE